MPWLRKPISRLQYWTSGSPSTAWADGFKTILVYCVGPPVGDPPAVLAQRQKPSRTAVARHLRPPKCTKCGSVGWVDPRPDWTEVIKFNKGVG
jgi:hypothetical protein